MACARRGSNGGLGLRASWLKGGGLGLQACVAADAAFHPLVCDAIHSVGRRGLAGNGFLRYQLGGRVTGGLGMRYKLTIDRAHVVPTLRIHM